MQQTLVYIWGDFSTIKLCTPRYLFRSSNRQYTVRKQGGCDSKRINVFRYFVTPSELMRNITVLIGVFLMLSLNYYVTIDDFNRHFLWLELFYVQVHLKIILIVLNRKQTTLDCRVETVGSLVHIQHRKKNSDATVDPLYL